jgi:ribonuclease HI
MEKQRIITIYTDGSALGNPGPGGWGSVLIWGNLRKEFSGGFKLTTNNRMEILAVIEALKALKAKDRLKVILHSDSKYVIDSISKGWIHDWKRRGWKRKTGPVLNMDLWQELLPLLTKHDIEFKWVPAHTGIPENERCDELAKSAAGQFTLPDDIGYINSINQKNDGII